ncbi:MAG TPA: adhesin, partial [Desulfobacteraceae bacterium]|nr:adhesin [Desulfobacteraceae bacterium]
EVLDEADLNALLKAKWNGMKAALASQDISNALNYFAEDKKDLYNDIYTALNDNLPQIVQDMQDIQLICVWDKSAKYRIRRDQLCNGQIYPITYYIYFMVDDDGLWKIYRY